MAKLVKISLMGVRSFGPENEDEQVITFQSPLTLILGQNGCGKTTIIESLKYACTNELPSGGGRDFVNDPHLSGNMSTKGVIKLQLANATGDKAVIVRVVSVEVKAKTSQFQTIDNSIVYKKPGGNVTPMVTMKIEELVRTVCGIMGVSKPIINHVLFCHQEDSLWPLDSPKTVKETFDKIFDATKYNRAVENLLKLNKKNKILLNLYLVQKEGLRNQKAHVEHERLKLHDKQAKLEDIQQQLQGKIVQLKPIEAKMKELSALEDNLKDLEKLYSAKDEELKGIDEHVKEIRKNLQEEYTDDDASLKRDIESFEGLENKWRNQFDELSRTKAKLAIQDCEIEKQIRIVQSKVADLKSSQDSNASQVIERNNLISNCQNEFKLKQHGALDFKEEVLEALSKLNEGYKRLEATSDTYIKRLEDDEIKQLRCLEALFKKKISLDQEVKLKSAQVVKVNKELVELHDKLQDLKVSNKKMAQFEMDISRMTKDIDKISQTFEPEKAERNIQTSKREIKDLKTSLENLEQDYDVLRDNHATEKMLQNLDCSVVSKQTDIEKIKNKHSSYFDDVFSNNTSGFKDVVLTMQRQNSSKITTIMQKINTTQKKLIENETVCKSKKSKLKDMIQERNNCDKEVKAVCKGKPYVVIRKELEEEVENLQSDKGQYTSAKIVYSKFIKAFESEKPCCPICATDFQNKKDSIIGIIKSLKGRIQSVPEDLKACTEKLKISQDKFNRVVKLEAINKRVEELSSYIDSIEIEITHTEQLIVNEKSNLQQLQEELKDPEKSKEVADKLIGDASLLDKYFKDLQSYESEREVLQALLITIDSTKSVEETKIEISELKDSISRHEHDVELEQRKLLQNRNKLQELKDRRAAENEKKLNLQKNMQGQPQLEEQYSKLQTDQENLTFEIERMKVDLATATEAHEEASSDLDLVKATNKAEVASNRNNLAKQKRMLENIEEIQKKIEDFESQGINKLLDRSVEEGVELQARKSQLSIEAEKITKEKFDIEKKIAGQNHELRKLTDNLLLREKTVLRDRVRNERDILKIKIAGQNYQKLHREKQSHNKEWHDLTNEIGKFKGQLTELSESIIELQLFLERPDKKNAHQKYLEMCYNIVAMQKGMQDLVHFTRAIEMSILKFHTERMKQINNVMRDLWRSIYQGNDIESIRIKTDNVTSTAARRTYNYSVMQVKNGVEIEMRGRCSAGQKVLACLIIRMALAETFSLHCGILALDEPTTNLDRQNIISLSEALVKLIEDRERDKNFQLLIITHDEEFLSTLQRAHKDAFYYYVTRNPKGFTRIQKRDTIG